MRTNRSMRKSGNKLERKLMKLDREYLAVSHSTESHDVLVDAVVIWFFFGDFPVIWKKITLGTYPVAQPELFPRGGAKKSSRVLGRTLWGGCWELWYPGAFQVMFVWGGDSSKNADFSFIILTIMPTITNLFLIGNIYPPPLHRYHSKILD